VPTAEFVKQLLHHPDHHVRNAAFEWFADIPTTDTAITHRLLDVLKPGMGFLDRPTFRCFERFPVDASALTRTLQLLERTDGEDLLGLLDRMLERAPATAESEAALAGCAKVAPKVRERVARRRRFAGIDAREHWAELTALSRRRHDATLSVEDEQEAEDRIRAMAGSGFPDASVLVPLIGSLVGSFEWLSLFAVQLAGVHRLSEAVPALLACMREAADDWLDQPVENALVAIGGDEVVRALRDVYGRDTGGGDDSLGNRLAISETLRRIKTDAAVDALLELLERETDVEMRTWLAASLCGQLTARVVEPVARVIRDGYDPQAYDLPAELLPVLDAYGLDHPRKERWRRERDSRERGSAARWAELLNPPPEPKVERIAPVAGAAMEKVYGPLPAPPEHRDSPKAGRNDPCPCGSGRKYKKCCLKA
jgi:hypothetical protein